MPAVSKAQQRFMGMVHAVKKGEMKAPSSEVAQAAASMKKKDAKDFASTKHDKLPEKKEAKESFTIDPKAHRQQQRSAKIRTLAQKGATEGERKAAERKTKGPKMFGEALRSSLLTDKKFMKKVDAEKKGKKKFSDFSKDMEAAKKRSYEVDKKTPYNVHRNTRYY